MIVVLMEPPQLMIMMTHNYWKVIENPNQRSIRERFVVTRKSLKRELALKMVIHSYLKHHWTQERSVLIRSSWISD